MGINTCKSDPIKLLAVCMLCSIFIHITQMHAYSTYEASPKPHHSYNTGDYQQPGPTDEILGVRMDNMQGVRITTQRLQQNKQITRKFNCGRQMPATLVDQERMGHRQCKKSPEVSHFPTNSNYALKNYAFGEIDSDDQCCALRKPQTLGVSFLGNTLPQVNLFPPASMGAVGPKQFIIATNGLIKSFDKNTGQADGVLNIDTDSFFASVSNNSFASDPRIRFDRMSGRWFILMINVDSPNNRIMFAVSDGSVITANTAWTFYYFNAGDNSFLNYPTLAIDAHALYVGGVTFSSVDTGQVFVINKQSALNGTAFGFAFHNLIDPVTGQGPYAPSGVDNFDVTAPAGYFIGVDNANFGQLMLRRVNGPGSATPTISGNIPLLVPSTQFPITVPHLGNNNGNQGKLDAIDDRLMSAHIRNGHLWTVHNIGVNNQGVSSNLTATTRNGSRWYEIDMTTSNPTLVQAGTLCAPSATNNLDQRSYWMPSLMTSGQGHMALGCSASAVNEYINAAVSGRFATDPLGTIQNATLYTASSSSYNPVGDPGSSDQVRRWGDYSYTSVDPVDDMTMWTIQAYCNAQNSWGVRAVKLIAPPPASLVSATPSSIPHGRSSIPVIIAGESVNGSGFFDPGLGFSSHLQVIVGGGVTVNSITYVNPTQINVNLSTVNATTGPKNVTVVNPDGQTVLARLITII